MRPAGTAAASQSSPEISPIASAVSPNASPTAAPSRFRGGTWLPIETGGFEGTFVMINVPRATVR
jgi:hypothetical protein